MCSWNSKKLTNTDFDLGLRIRSVKCYVWTVLLSLWHGGMDTEFEMWVYRRVLRIPWTTRRTNDEVLRIVNNNRELLETQREVQISAIDNWGEDWGKERNRQEKDVLAPQRYAVDRTEDNARTNAYHT